MIFSTYDFEAKYIVPIQDMWRNQVKTLNTTLEISFSLQTEKDRNLGTYLHRNGLAGHAEANLNCTRVAKGSNAVLFVAVRVVGRRRRRSELKRQNETKRNPKDLHFFFSTHFYN